jgi:hypothetical protein
MVPRTKSAAEATRSRLTWCDGRGQQGDDCRAEDEISDHADPDARPRPSIDTRERVASQSRKEDRAEHEQKEQIAEKQSCCAQKREAEPTECAKDAVVHGATLEATRWEISGARTHGVTDHARGARIRVRGV